MKISNKTGEIFIGLEDKTPIGPKLSRDRFLKSSFGRKSESVVNNAPYFSFLLPPITVNETAFSLSVQYWDDLLQAVELVDCHQRFETPSWCEETEIRRKQEHERWLKEVWSMPPGHYGWGRVASLFDRRCGCSMIFITYGG